MSVDMSSENNFAASGEAQNAVSSGGVAATAAAWLKSPVFWSVCLYLCAIAVLYLRIGTNPAQGEIFNSDSLFPIHVAKDVLFDGSSLRGWTFCPSPFIFPDAIATAFFYLLTGNTILSCFLTGVFFVTMTSFGFSYCGRVCGISDSRIRLCLAFLTAGIYLLSLAGGVRYISHHVLFLQAFHSGAYMCIIWLAGFMLAAFNEKPGTARRRRLLLAFATLTFLTAMGDPLILPMLVGPATAAALGCWFVGLLQRRQLYVPIFLLWTCSVAGIFVIRRLIYVVSASVVGSPGLNRSLIAIKNLTTFFTEALLAGDITHVLAVVWFVGCCVMIFLGLRGPKLTKDDPQPIATGGRTAFIFGNFLLSMLAMFAAPVIVGHGRLVEAPLSYEYILHYCHPFLFGPIFGLPLVLAAIISRNPVAWRVPEWTFPMIGVPAAIGLIAFMAYTGVGHYSLHGGRTEFVMKLDDIIAKHHLKRGVTEYWKCRQLCTMSHTGAQIIPIMPVDMSYYPWMHNSRHIRYNDIQSANYVPYDFIVTSPIDGLTREDVIARFGDPVCIEPVDAFGIPHAARGEDGRSIDVEVLIYNRPEDARFHRFFDSPFNFPGYRRVIDAAKLPSDVGRLEEDQRIAESGRDGEGFVTFGPYVKLPAGEYSVAFQIAAENDAEAPVGKWDIIFADQVAQSSEIIADGDITAAQKEIRYEFQVTPEQEDDLMEARILYTGKGRIAVKSMELQRLR